MRKGLRPEEIFWFKDERGKGATGSAQNGTPHTAEELAGQEKEPRVRTWCEEITPPKSITDQGSQGNEG